MEVDFGVEVTAPLDAEGEVGPRLLA
jgi:hypothetical protein